MAHGGAAVPTVAELIGDLDDDTEPNREGQGHGIVRNLTTNLPGWSARHGEGCRRRDRRRTPDGVVAVNRRIPAMSSSPGSVRRRGGRGDLGEASGGGDSQMVVWSSG